MGAEYALRARTQDRQILRLAWPCILENIFATMVGFIDTAMIGALGASATASVGVVASFTWLLSGLVQSLGVGGTAIVARMIGAGEKKDAERVTGQVFFMALALSALLMALVLAFAPLVPRLMQADPSLHGDAATYLRCLSLGVIPNYVGLALSGVLRGAGDTRTPMVSGLLANLMNVVLNFLLIYSSRTISVLGASFPVWGAGMGVAGAAVASAISTGCAGLYVIFHMTRRKTALRLSFETEGKKRFRMDGDICRRVLRIGTPAALERVVVNLGQMAFAGMISAIGVTEIAAHTLAIEIEGLGYMPAFGFAAAATALVGQNLGAGDRERARFAGKRTAILCTALLTGVGICTFLFAPFLISLFTPDEKVRLVGAELIRICSFEQPFNALTNVYSGALRGAGDTRVPLIYSFVSMWCVRILLAWVFGIGMGLGVYAIWWCMVADLGVRSLLLYLRFRRGKWMWTRV